MFTIFWVLGCLADPEKIGFGEKSRNLENELNKVHLK